ncbi:hypothetical protein ZIOFF_059552 [Zingiber officinale]|uniref:Uncharacterized protein n=1 Tax=Zingiber officinale TaxID=94328 RepID=A0A8J5KMR7_ZINOF|nr:hypothetical protein ZIOFF_059552 [Zingiber officinale]
MFNSPHLIYVMTFLPLVFLFLISPSLNLLVRFYSWIVEGMVRMITLRNSDGEVFEAKEAMGMDLHRRSSLVTVARPPSESIDPENPDFRYAEFQAWQFQSSPAFPGSISLVLVPCVTARKGLSSCDKLLDLDPEIERTFRASRIQERISTDSESSLSSSDTPMADHSRTMKELAAPDEAFNFRINQREFVAFVQAKTTIQSCAQIFIKMS